jgi:hypothetical protein
VLVLSPELFVNNVVCVCSLLNKHIHNIYKAMQGRELTHTQYLKKESEDKTKTYTIFTKLFRVCPE